MMQPQENWQHTIRQTYRVFCVFNRLAELNRLVLWAERKRLKNPLRLYTNLSTDTERRLLRYQLDSPRSVAAAKVAFVVKTRLFPSSATYSRGAARGFRSG